MDGGLAGIVPEPAWLERIERFLSLELGLLGSLLLLGAGVGWSVRLVYQWGAGGFGALDPTEMMRDAIPAVTLMIVGAQAAAGTLFAGALHSCWHSVNGHLRRD